MIEREREGGRVEKEMEGGKKIGRVGGRWGRSGKRVVPETVGG